MSTQTIRSKDTPCSRPATICPWAVEWFLADQLRRLSDGQMLGGGSGVYRVKSPASEGGELGIRNNRIKLKPLFVHITQASPGPHSLAGYRGSTHDAGNSSARTSHHVHLQERGAGPCCPAPPFKTRPLTSSRPFFGSGRNHLPSSDTGTLRNSASKHQM